LKGFLTFHQIEVRRTHDLKDLLTECGNVDSSFAKWEKDCERLTDYAVEARYPERFYEHSTEEAEEAVSVATRLKEFVRSKIRLGDFNEDDPGRTA
jgi:HEPN domain-containing protein